MVDTATHLGFQWIKGAGIGLLFHGIGANQIKSAGRTRVDLDLGNACNDRERFSNVSTIEIQVNKVISNMAAQEK